MTDPGRGTVAPVSLVMTVLNEIGSLPAFLARLELQSVLPAEVVIVDGGSTDGTWELLAEAALPDGVHLRCLQMPGANISAGRNAAIRESSSEIVLVTDGGVTLSPAWVERLWTVLRDRPDVHVAAGFFEPAGSTFFERALARTITPLREQIDSETFLPSSRSVGFRRDVWRDAGGYPEWLDYCEDLVFDLAMKRVGAKFQFVPEAVAEWSARSSWTAFARQYYRYARGDGKADLWRRRHLVRYAAYVGVAGVWTRSRLAAAVLLGVGGAVYVLPYVRRVLASAELQGRDRIRAIAMVPAVMLLGDGAKMAGYPVGVLWRRRYRSVASGSEDPAP